MTVGHTDQTLKHTMSQYNTNTLRRNLMQPIGLFHTPKDMDELQTWLKETRDPLTTVAAMMMYNLLVTNYSLEEKEIES